MDLICVLVFKTYKKKDQLMSFGIAIGNLNTKYLIKLRNY